MTTIQLSELAGYLEYGLQMANGKYMGEVTCLFTNGDFKITCSNWHENIKDNKYKPLLLPLSAMTENINYGYQSYQFTDLFEIGENGGFDYEFYHGNVKLINSLKTMAQYNVYHDFNYMPFAVIQEAYKHHFDVHNLIGRGLALDKRYYIK